METVQPPKHTLSYGSRRWGGIVDDLKAQATSHWPHDWQVESSFVTEAPAGNHRVKEHC